MMMGREMHQDPGRTLHREQFSELIEQRLRHEILPLFDQAMNNEDVLFENPNLVDCRKEQACRNEECPVFDQRHLRCWQISGTFCGGKSQGAFLDKYNDCKSCRVFTRACPTIIEELGEYFNNFLHLIRKRKKKEQIQRQSVDHLNKELRLALKDLHSRNMKIQALVITDKLTGLYNRHHLQTVLEEEIMRCARKTYCFSILMIDVDNFKSVNDHYGHIFGDKILAELGRVIKRSIRKYDRAFRFGGEEFVVILPETDQTMAWMVAERIRENFARTSFTVMSTEEVEKKIVRTLSIGTSTYTEGLTSTEMIKCADMALYTAKSQGRNRVVRSSDIVNSLMQA